MGMYLPMNHILGILILACVLAGIAGLFLIATGKKKGKDSLPFVPFLLVASVVEVILGG
jgi:prepilin signal peptidase PulO-like enzyme (type II secretory pathway)